MDPLSQGVVGVTLPQALIKKNGYMKWGFLFAFLGGMAPDLDILIKSSTDSILELEYHRQFTHSLLFIPFGGLICAGFFHFIFRKPMPFKLNYLYTTLGFATHGLLDACTTYGTLLFWPFTNMRVAWNNVSIIDPLFTIPLLILIFISFFKNTPRYGRIALVYGVCYLLLGLVQRERAVNYGKQIALERGHQYLSIDAKPSFANILLWKIIYQTETKYYADAVRMGLSPQFYEGESLDKLNLKRDFPWLEEGSTHAKDIERFRWFSMGYLAKHPSREDFIYDVRYSLLPNSMSGLWGIQLYRDNQESHVLFQQARGEVTEKDKSELLRMLFQ
ncbi:MAG: metal-dependent hydrolase [Bdellovibrionales bacterium]|nr:metal-dependent hydrolase [Bdellovibrionales bacterium]NQZ19637.1 metal-dependent hydrolase [Bdellovibrionales bacterium]